MPEHFETYPLTEQERKVLTEYENRLNDIASAGVNEYRLITIPLAARTVVPAAAEMPPDKRKEYMDHLGDLTEGLLTADDELALDGAAYLLEFEDNGWNTWTIQPDLDAFLVECEEVLALLPDEEKHPTTINTLDLPFGLQLDFLQVDVLGTEIEMLPPEIAASLLSDVNTTARKIMKRDFQGFQGEQEEFWRSLDALKKKYGEYGFGKGLEEE